MTLSGRHSEVRAGVGLDPMLLGGCNHLGPRVGPPLLKLVPCLPVDSKPFLAAVGGHPFWGHTFHPPSSDVLALLAWGLGLPRTQRSVWWEWAEACKPLWSAGKDTGRLCLPSQHHGQRRPPTPPPPPPVGCPAWEMTPVWGPWVLAGEGGDGCGCGGEYSEGVCLCVWVCV